jgi:transposase
MEDRQRRTRRQFTEEFKGDAVDLVRTTGRPIAQRAGPAAAAGGRQRPAAMERDLLKRTVAFWVTETSTP